MRSLCCPLSICAEANPQVSRMHHKTRALSLLVRLFNLMKTADFLAGWELFSARAWDSAVGNERKADCTIVLHAHGARPNLFERNPAIQGRARKRTGAHNYSTKPLRAQPRHTPAKFSLRSLNLPSILSRGFARRAFRLFAPAGFLQGFFELQERTKGGICARSEKSWRENPRSLSSVDRNPHR